MKNKVIVAAAWIAISIAGGAGAYAAEPAAGPVQHEFVIHGFRTEGGAVLPEAHVVYGTYGVLDAAGDNAVLLPSHYMADMHGYEWLVGPGKALDPNKLFLVASELFGNGRSSSPSNTPTPLHGPDFPAMTIRDNVEAVHRLLAEQLHVHHLRAVIGFSMGAQQAQEWWRRELWRSENPPGTTFAQAVAHYTHDFFAGADANNLILQMRTWESNDVGNTAPFKGDTQAALRSIRVPVLYMPSATDLYFPVEDARYEAQFIPHCTLLPIPSLWGHPAGAGASPADAVFLNRHIAAFMKDSPGRQGSL